MYQLKTTDNSVLTFFTLKIRVILVFSPFGGGDYPCKYLIFV